MSLATAHLSFPYPLDTTAITMGALSGALHATRKQMGILGILAVAFATGLGGGAIRDVILDGGTPSFLVRDAVLGYAVLGAFIGYFFARVAGKFENVYVILDALLIGVWVIIASTKALQQNLGAVAAVYVGLVAATGGGLLRDLLCKDPPSVLRPGQWYAIAAFGAAVTFVWLHALDVPIIFTQVATLVVAAALRIVSLVWTMPSPTPYDISDRVIRIFRPVRR